MRLNPNSGLTAADLSPKEIGNTSHLWVFGYGSILWNTGFAYRSKICGRIRGYVRRFWQGNTTHRGTTNAPGRVATLVGDCEGEVWGEAYELVGQEMIEKALNHLGLRECTLGGYAIMTAAMESRDGMLSVPVLLFSATPNNSLYLGPAPVKDIAKQVTGCSGSSGPNVEYVCKLAEYVRRHIPEDCDHHLFDIDRHICDLGRQRHLRVNSSLAPDVRLTISLRLKTAREVPNRYSGAERGPRQTSRKLRTEAAIAKRNWPVDHWSDGKIITGSWSRQSTGIESAMDRPTHAVQ